MKRTFNLIRNKVKDAVLGAVSFCFIIYLSLIRKVKTFG